MLFRDSERASQTSALNIDDDRYYSHYLIRRLPAEVILDAFSQVTGVPEKFEGYPLGTRALQLPDTRVKSYFLTAFGRPERLVTSAAERQQDPTLAQALHVINGDTLNRKLMAEGGTIDRLLKDIITRCRELRLRLTTGEEETRREITVLLTVQTMNYLHSGRHRMAL